MAARPYWRGQIRIALVYLPVHVYSAVNRSEHIAFHEIDRTTGERVHHRNVTEDGTEVERDDIIKGFEYSKGRHILLEEEEIEAIKLPSSSTLELTQFVDADSIPLAHYEKPYYVLPDSKEAEEIYEVLRKALTESGKAGIGQITLRGREELCCVRPYDKGLVLEVLRYPNEVRDTKEMFEDLRPKPVRKEYVELARELIDKNSGKLDLDQFHDHYQEALMELIKAKKENREPDLPKEEPPQEKVVNLMDALRNSLKHSPSARARVPGGKKPSTARRRKSA